VERVTPSPEEVRQAARIAGLRSFHTPSLEAVERRRLQLWILTLLLLLAVAAGVILIALLEEFALPVWLTPAVIHGGLLGLVILFSAYAIEKEMQLRRLTRLLVEERVLTAALTNRLQELNALLEAGKAINLDLTLDQVFETILRCARDLLHGRDCSILLVHGDREMRTVKIAGESGAQGARLSVGEGIAGQVAATREPMLIQGVVDRGGGRKPSPPPPMSAMSVPLVHRDRLLGVLNINSAGDRVYSEHDLRALSLFGEHAAIAIVNAQLYEAQRLAVSQTSYQAFHDGLTGLANRTLFLDRLDQALARRRGRDERVALLFIDLDDFKRINDSLGHAIGDEVLIAVAERLRSSTRAADTVSRFGGDEFAVLVEGVRSEGEALSAADRILACFAEPLAAAARGISLGVTIGIALGDVEDASEQLIRCADSALHVAKRAEKGAVRVYDPSMHMEALERLDMEAELTRALDDGDLEAHYQPIYELDTRRVVAVEALARWHHPTRGLLPAAAFVPLAEQAGLLPRIDGWLLRASCGWLSRLDAPLSLNLNLNLSAGRLREASLVDEVEGTLGEHSIEPSRLTLEITESGFLQDLDATSSRLSVLHQLGIRLALDDFGTGYSSLSHLNRFPVDVLKIDKAFIEALDREGNGRNLVKAIVRLGQGLDLDTVAEGVERESQMAALRELGCRHAQGYLLARPMGGDDLQRLLTG
jgi:diguanylate cyclase (GGDEF)-like protein